jgi:serine protease
LTRKTYFYERFKTQSLHFSNIKPPPSAMKPILIQALLCLNACLLFAQNTKDVSPKLDHRSGQLLVQFIDSQSFEQFEKTQPAFVERFEWIVAPLSIGRVFFSEKMDENLALATLRKHPSVRFAQFNHILENRATPNDPNFTNQWFHRNSGQNGGTADADIDSDEAWDITRGGVTTDGDSIVVAVIDNGTNLTHPDLQNNLWLNRQETPNNGIDDDRNGYIDDARGWNSSTQSDAVEGGTHGVEVAGVIGAIGNNGRGVSGVNWAVKIMTIVSGGDESEIVAAYAYVLAQRRLYNRTRGRRGAFVVATNSSFGASNKFPRDAPMWCAMYDSLGMAGVLNIGATANANINVDEVGDLPSTCLSPYTIIVTASNDRDQKAGDAAFGKTHVDMAAPGVGIWTTLANGDYGPKTGTSLACPVVAGVVALAYAVNCPDFINSVKNNPSAMALALRQRILAAVDTNANFREFVATGGRINAKLALQNTLGFCSTCNQPARVRVEATQNNAVLSFATPTATTVTTRIRKRGTTTWQPITAGNTPLSISNLEACTDYEIELITVCSARQSTPFIFTFKTDGCCTYPENVLITNVLNNQISIRTTKVTAATGYRVCLKESATAANCNITQTFPDTVFTVNNLKRCQDYQLAVSAVCPNGLQSTDTILTLKTKGCGVCLDLDYCRSNGSTASEWIDSFSIANFKIQTPKSNGYQRFDTVATELASGKQYTVGIKPAYSGGVNFNESLRIWIDINQDGDFGDIGEQIVEIQRFNVSTRVNFTMPEVPMDGISRMRVTMKYTGFSGTLAQPCEVFSGGEVKDFCVALKKSVSTIEILRGVIKVFPNPFDNYLTVKNGNSDNPISALSLYAVDGRALYYRRVQSSDNELFISDLPPLSKGVYFLKVETKGGTFAVKLIK